MWELYLQFLLFQVVLTLFGILQIRDKRLVKKQMLTGECSQGSVSHPQFLCL